MAGLRLAIDPTGMTSGGKVAENALDAVKRKADQAASALHGPESGIKRSGDAAAAAAPKIDSAGRAMGSMTGLAVKAGAAIGAMAGAFLSMRAITGTFRMFRDSTIEAEGVQAQLAAALVSTGGAAQRNIGQLNAVAASLQKTTVFGDEATNAMQGLLLTFANIKGDVFDQATVAVQNVATALHTDLQSAALQVGKALNDPVLGMTALSRSGIQFSEAQKEAVKAMVETNNIVGAQAIILAELEKQFGGSAVAARDTLGGALKSLGNAWGDLFELSGPPTDNLKKSVESLIGAVTDPSFVAAIQGIGSAFFGAAEVAVDALTILGNNIDEIASIAGAFATFFAGRFV